MAQVEAFDEAEPTARRDPRAHGRSAGFSDITGLNARFDLAFDFVLLKYSIE